MAAGTAESGTAMTGDWSVSTGDGGVALYLPSDFGAELDAHTNDGSIRNELAVAAEADDDRGRRDGDEERHTLRRRLGSGGRMLKIRTGDGSIRLKAS